eukprot:g2045.t1
MPSEEPTEKRKSQEQRLRTQARTEERVLQGRRPIGPGGMQRPGPIGPGGTRRPPPLGPGGTRRPPPLGPGGTRRPPPLGPGGIQPPRPPRPITCGNIGAPCQGGVQGRGCCSGLTCRSGGVPGGRGVCQFPRPPPPSPRPPSPRPPRPSCNVAGSSCQPGVFGQACCGNLRCVGASIPGGRGVCRPPRPPPRPQCRPAGRRCQKGVRGRTCCGGLQCLRNGRGIPRGQRGICGRIPPPRPQPPRPSCKLAGSSCQPGVFGQACCGNLRCVGASIPGGRGVCRPPRPPPRPQCRPAGRRCQKGIRGRTCCGGLQCLRYGRRIPRGQRGICGRIPRPRPQPLPIPIFPVPVPVPDLPPVVEPGVIDWGASAHNNNEFQLFSTTVILAFLLAIRLL